MRCTNRALPWFGGAISLALAGIGCGGAGGEAQSDFDAYVPSATPVVHVADTDAVRVPLGLSKSLVIEIGEGLAGQPNQFQIAVDSNGRVVTLDVIDGGLRRFEPSGKPLVWTATNAEVLKFDRAPLGLFNQGGDLLLTNAYPGRLRLVAKSGKLMSDLELENNPWKPSGLGDGTFVAMLLESGVVGRYSLDGTELARYTVAQLGEAKLGGDTRLWPHLDVAVGSETVYVTTAETYQVIAFDVEGGSRWVLQGDGQRIAIPEHISGKTLGRSRPSRRARCWRHDRHRIRPGEMAEILPGVGEDNGRLAGPPLRLPVRHKREPRQVSS